MIKIMNKHVFLVCNFTLFSVLCYADPEFQLGFPVDCQLDQDCWIANYVDVDPEPGSAKDFSCGPRSYDNHKGTDIAIRDWQVMEQGVDVLAAAKGMVLRIRDGVKDSILSREALNKIKQENKSCGNGVIIEHEEGWQTIYCHLKQSSIVVKPNQRVKSGEKIGQVGHSGFVEFPHLHIGVLHDNKLIDPYTGFSNEQGCGIQQQPLWEDESLANYEPVSLYAAGFSNVVPEFEQIKRNASSPEHLSIDSPALTFWILIFGVEKEDQIDMEIRNPNNEILVQKLRVQEKTRARQFFYIGKKNSNSDLIKGEYTGSVIVRRRLQNGEVMERVLHKILILK